jgi:small subunit ribosomal protein S7
MTVKNLLLRKQFTLLSIFKEALENITPKVEVRSRRIGGATYQIPVEVSPRRGSALALKWLKTSIENIKGKDLSTKISTVVLESLENKGWAAKKKEEVFKMAEANKAFAHYRW